MGPRGSRGPYSWGPEVGIQRRKNGGNGLASENRERVKGE